MSEELWFLGQVAAVMLAARLAERTGVGYKVTMRDGRGTNDETWKVVPSIRRGAADKAAIASLASVETHRREPWHSDLHVASGSRLRGPCGVVDDQTERRARHATSAPGWRPARPMAELTCPPVHSRFDRHCAWLKPPVTTVIRRCSHDASISVSIVKSKTSEVVGSKKKMFTLKAKSDRQFGWDDIYGKTGKELQCVPRVVSGT